MSELNEIIEKYEVIDVIYDWPVPFPSDNTEDFDLSDEKCYELEDLRSVVVIADVAINGETTELYFFGGKNSGYFYADDYEYDNNPEFLDALKEKYDDEEEEVSCDIMMGILEKVNDAFQFKYNKLWTEDVLSVSSLTENDIEQIADLISNDTKSRKAVCEACKLLTPEMDRVYGLIRQEGEWSLYDEPEKVKNDLYETIDQPDFEKYFKRKKESNFDLSM